MPRLELLHYESVTPGRRPPLLFVHGVCHGAWCWEEFFLPYFASKGWDAYAVSLRGHGGSEGRDQLDSFGLQDYVDDVLAAVAQIGVKPVVIGHSMGGGITQLTLRRAPEKIAAAVLFASMPPGYLQPGDESPMPPQPAGMLAMMHLLEGKTLTADQVMSLPFFGGRISPTQAERYVPLLQSESATARADIQKMNTEAGPVSVPLLVLGSRADSLFSEIPVRRTAAHYGVEAVVLDQGCHDLMLDPNWQSSADAMLRWLETIFAVR
jgi:pimeloyl-ACP methyl ester carboxylesterase